MGILLFQFELPQTKANCGLVGVVLDLIENLERTAVRLRGCGPRAL
jgi:hypothetical protein